MIEADRQTKIEVDRPRQRQTDRQTGEADRQTHKHCGRQTNIEADTKTEKQTNIETHSP